MFTIILKNEKLSSFNRLGLFILLIHGLYFTGYFLKVSSNVNFIALVSGIVIAFVGFGLNISSAAKSKRPLVPFSIIFLVIAIVWAGLLNYWLCIALLILAIHDLTVRKKPAVAIFEDRIEVMAFPKKTYQWSAFNNVILKDRILTLDLRDDRLIQSEISEESYHIDESAFNLFCRQKLVV